MWPSVCARSTRVPLRPRVHARTMISTMLAGDLRTFPLADFLQWADSSRARGVLSIFRPSGVIWMQLLDRAVVACVRPLSEGTLPEQLVPNLSGDVELEASAIAT